MREPRRRRNWRIHSGWAGQAGAVTRWPSVRALEAVSFTAPKRAPAAVHSGPQAG